MLYATESVEGCCPLHRYQRYNKLYPPTQPIIDGEVPRYPLPAYTHMLVCIKKADGTWRPARDDKDWWAHYNKPDTVVWEEYY